jgi:Ca2+-binding EF-hand superfamily protein
MGKKYAKSKVRKIFAQTDYEGKGTIDYSEFVIAGMSRDKILNKKRLKAAFHIFDKDGNGVIDISELKEVFRNSGNISDEVYK